MGKNATLKIVFMFTTGILLIICLFIYMNKGNNKKLLNEIIDDESTIFNEARALDSFEKEEIEKYPELQKIFNELQTLDTSTTAHNNIKVVYGDLYTSKLITPYGDQVTYRSLPRVIYTVSDVGTAGSTNLNCRFDIIECVNVNGDLNSGWENAISIRIYLVL